MFRSNNQFSRIILFVSMGLTAYQHKRLLAPTNGSWPVGSINVNEMRFLKDTEKVGSKTDSLKAGRRRHDARFPEAVTSFEQ